MSIGELCNREVVIVDRGDSIRAAARLMRAHHVGDVVVVDERQGKPVPVGILSDRDLVVEVLAQDVPRDAVSVGDVMSNDLLTVHERDELLDTIKRMKVRGVRRVMTRDAGACIVVCLSRTRARAQEE